MAIPALPMAAGPRREDPERRTKRRPARDLWIDPLPHGLSLLRLRGQAPGGGVPRRVPPGKRRPLRPLGRLSWEHQAGLESPAAHKRAAA